MQNRWMRGLGTMMMAAGLWAGGTGCARNYSATPASLGPAGAARVEAAGVERADVRVRQGTLRFATTESEQVGYSVRVGPARGALGVPRTCTLDLERPAAVDVEREGAVLRLRLAESAGDGCVEDWVVELPRRLSLSARLDAGSIVVAGAAQDLRLEAGAGSIEVTGAVGAIEAKVGVGTIRVSHSGNGGGAVWLRTNVGEVDLFVNGRKLGRSRAPGAGDQLSLDGATSQVIRLTANVGDIELKLATPGH